MKTAPALLSIAIVAAMLVACRGDGGGGRSDEPIIIHFGLAAADLNRDGLTDFVSGSATLDGGPPPHPGRLRVYLQRSSAPGQYRQSAVLDTSFDPGEIRIADFNADGVLDVAVHKENLADSAGSIALFFQNGAADGTFAATEEVANDLVSHFDAADVDGDGLSDILTDADGPHILFNDPRNPGTFPGAVPIGE